MLRTGLVLLVVAAGAGVATAEGPVPITLHIGETRAFDVGFAMGSQCDDTRIVRSEMQAKSFETNSFVLTGLAEGTTLCRAGFVDESARPSYLFQITVVR